MCKEHKCLIKLQMVEFEFEAEPQFESDDCKVYCTAHRNISSQMLVLQVHRPTRSSDGTSCGSSSVSIMTRRPYINPFAC